MRRISQLLVPGLLGLGIVAAAAGARQDTTLALVAYSTPNIAFGKLIAASRGQDEEAGRGLPQPTLPPCRLAGHERTQRAEHVPLGPRRRPAHVRERGDPRAAAGSARVLPDPEGDDPDREPDRRR